MECDSNILFILCWNVHNTACEICALTWPLCSHHCQHPSFHACSRILWPNNLPTTHFDPTCTLTPPPSFSSTLSLLPLTRMLTSSPSSLPRSPPPLSLLRQSLPLPFPLPLTCTVHQTCIYTNIVCVNICLTYIYV